MKEQNPNSPLLKYPHLGYISYLLSILVDDLGIQTSNGFGPAPQTWQELDAWCNVTGISLTYWESSTIIHLSKVFVASYNRYNETNEPAPYQPPDLDRDAVAKNVKNFFQSLMARRNRNVQPR